MVLLVIALSDDNSDCMCDHSEYNRCWVDDDNIGGNIELMMIISVVILSWW